MAWVPIAESGIQYGFWSDEYEGDYAATMTGSVITQSGDVGWYNAWTLGSSPNPLPLLRLTFSDFTGDGYIPPKITVGATDFINGDTAPYTQWVPNPLEIPAGLGVGLAYYNSQDSEENAQPNSYTLLVEVWVDEPPAQNDPHNCDCDTGTEGNETRATLRTRLLSMLGYGAQGSNPPPGMAELLNNFLDMAQRKLYTRLTEYGWVRFFNWPLVKDVYLFDVPDNIDGCPRKLNPRKIQWVGIHKDGIYRPLAQGIDPSLYSHDIMAQWPTRYEIRQCIEIWPKPSSDGGYLVIKGGFGLDPFNTDNSVTTVKSDLVFLQALADAKAHYRKPDAGNIQQQVEVMLSDIVAGGHMTARYIPGRGRSTADPGWAYDWPVATPPFPVS